MAFDAIVLGLGGIGSAAVFALARRGLRVLGLEQAPRARSLGSSASPSRGFRKAHARGDAYVALAKSSHRLWQELEARSGRSLLNLTGGLLVGAADHPALREQKVSLERHGLPHELLSASELARRHPMIRAGDGEVAILEVEAGILLADDCNAAHLEAAERLGATLHFDEALVEIVAGASDVVARTSRDQYRAKRAVVTVGPWLARLAELPAPAGLGSSLPLRIERQVELWFEPTRPEDFEPSRLPLFHFADVEGRGTFYGVPRLDERGVKACRHYGGAITSVAQLERRVLPEDEREVRAFLELRMPSAGGRLLHGKVCMNANTPDMHFIVGPVPERPNLVVLGGCSGHGYKFVPVMGEIAADLVELGRTDHPIELFSPDRFAPRRAPIEENAG
jgi:sarcosine oxidase